ncbi:MAG: branched-chain amino acid ABC transporter permease [Halanaeroarchaeum sp.]
MFSSMLPVTSLPAWGIAASSGGGVDRFVEPFASFLRDVIALEPVLLQLLVFAILLGGVYALTALGLTMIFGVMDVINFAHGIFLVVGMYVVWYASTAGGINPFLGIPLAFLVLFVLGVVIHVLTIEPIIEAPQQNQLIVTLGILFIIQAAIEIVFSPNPKSLNINLGSLQVGGSYIPNGQLYALGIAVVSMIGVWLFLQRTELGRNIRGTADNRDAARYVGINVERINYVTFGLGAALAGLAGASIVLFQRFDPFTGDTYLINAFVIVILGGLGSFPGAFVGGMIIGFIQVFGSYYLPGTTAQILIFLIFIVTLLVKPTGLMGGTT